MPWLSAAASKRRFACSGPSPCCARSVLIRHSTAALISGRFAGSGVRLVFWQGVASTCAIVAACTAEFWLEPVEPPPELGVVRWTTRFGCGRVVVRQLALRGVRDPCVLGCLQAGCLPCEPRVRDAALAIGRSKRFAEAAAAAGWRHVSAAQTATGAIAERVLRKLVTFRLSAGFPHGLSLQRRIWTV